MEVSRKIDKLGRIVLPIDFRRKLGLLGEARVVIRVEGDIVTVRGSDCLCRLCASPIDTSQKSGICPACVRKIKAI